MLTQIEVNSNWLTLREFLAQHELSEKERLKNEAEEMRRAEEEARRVEEARSAPAGAVNLDSAVAPPQAPVVPAAPVSHLPLPVPPVPAAAKPSSATPPALPSPRGKPSGARPAAPVHWLMNLDKSPVKRIKVLRNEDKFDGTATFEHPLKLTIWKAGGGLTHGETAEIQLVGNPIESEGMVLKLVYKGIVYANFPGGELRVMADGFSEAYPAHQIDIGHYEAVDNSTAALFFGGTTIEVCEIVAYALPPEAVLAICNTCNDIRFRFSNQRENIDMFEAWGVADYFRQYAWAFRDMLGR